MLIIWPEVQSFKEGSSKRQRKCAEKLNEYRLLVLCLSRGSKVTCFGLGWSNVFNSADQNSTNWHQDPSAHWINPPLSSIWLFFVFFISSIHFFIHSVDFWKGRGDMSWGVYLHVPFFFSGKDEISSLTFVDWGVTSSYILLLSFSLSLLDSLPRGCEIDWAFVGSSNGAGGRASEFGATLVTPPSQKCCWGKR